MVANRCQSKKKKKKKYENIKIFYSEKKFPKLSWPKKNKIKKNIIQKKTHKIIMTHECQIWYFFWIASKNFWLLSAIVELVEKEEEIRKNIRTWGCWTSHFQLWRFQGEWGGGHKFLFSSGQIFRQKLLYHIVAMIGLKHFRIVTLPRFLTFPQLSTKCQ